MTYKIVAHDYPHKNGLTWADDHSSLIEKIKGFEDDGYDCFEITIEEDDDGEMDG